MTRKAWRVVGGALLVGAILAGGIPAGLRADDTWPAFQNGGQVVLADAKLPLEWSPEAAVALSTQLGGYGQSTPVVDDRLIYVTSTSGDMKENLHIQALDRATGKERWRHDAKNSSPEKSTTYVSRAAPTPVCDAEGVIAAFEGGNVIALDREGKVRWQRDLVADYGPITARHGLGASLEQDASRVFVWVERQEQPYLLALAKDTGQTVWKVDGLGATSWSSPRLVPTGQGPHLVCSASGRIAGFDPASGERLWDFTEIANNTVCTPIPVGEGRFLIGASDGRGEQNRGEGAASNGLVQISRQADGSYKAEFVWQAKKASSSFGSPIAAGNRVWVVNRVGVLFQLDLETGEERAADRIGAGGIWATPLVLGNHLYLFGYQGTTSVVSLPDGKEVAANRLWEQAPGGNQPAGFGSGGPVLYAATVASPYLLLRRGDLLYAVASQAGTP